MAADATAARRRDRRRDAEDNRERILRTAQTLLVTDPGASMEDLARAAGVVRRTVYAHFPSREALVAGLAEKAGADMVAALGGVDRSTLDPTAAMADFALTIWAAGGQYRLLINLAQGRIGPAGLRSLLAPVSEQALALLRRGRDEGVFARHLPVPVLGAALQAMTLALLRSVNDGLWAGDGTQAAAAILIAAGVPAAEVDPAIQRACRLRAAVGEP